MDRGRAPNGIGHLMILNNMLKNHDNIPHIKGVIATWVKHKCTGKLEVFITANCSPDAQKPLTPWTPISQVPLTPWTPKKINNSICVGGICIHSTIIYKLQSHTGTILPAVLHFGQETNTRALCALPFASPRKGEDQLPRKAANPNGPTPPFRQDQQS